ncbi:DUF3887 domain-containing protein [Facklamia miroungae]|uniref:DUF3887 domain-containing protein n=1 Tax=Facklamia miroungae TaxID=120956 RepID=A0A1G7PV67_9LACT|nr:DUF3887 domain-containing protein [Facklamia miroungae]NKZ28842.1 DUF3887 domain-containing protein [Facklamia miroungae]SDF90154.1 Protein of unknown function [Facklamia miroungae]
MKKKLLATLSTIVILMLCGCGNKVDDTTSEKYISQAKEIVSLINESNYDEVYTMFNDEMKAALPVKSMSEITPLITDSGVFKKIDKASVEERDGNYITVLVAKYSKGNRIYTITFEDDLEVAGLYIK